MDSRVHLIIGGIEMIVPQAEVSKRASQSYVDAIARALNP